MNGLDTARPIRILFVDDEQSVLNALRRALRKEGYEMIFSTDPEEALRTIGERQVDIVVSDHLMPNMTGIEFLSLVSRLHAQVFRIVLTGQADVNMAITAINEGQVNRFMTKPWDDGELKTVLRQAAKELVIRRRMEEAQKQGARPLPFGSSNPHPSIKRDVTGTIVLDDPNDVAV